jgi:hypothetical protein
VETHEALSWSYYERPNFTLCTLRREFKLVCKIKSINYDKIDEKLEWWVYKNEKTVEI